MSSRDSRPGVQQAPAVVVRSPLRIAGLALLALLVYLVGVRWLLIDALYEWNALGPYTAVIEALNRATHVNFGAGPHPLAEYRVRSDLLLLQACLALGAIAGLVHVLRSRQGRLLLLINVVMLVSVFSGFEALLETNLMQRRFVSERAVAHNEIVNRRNKEQTNSLGFTDRERDRQAAPGVYRIAVLGDSFVWGDGVRDLRDVWSHILEDSLRARYGDAVEVLSWGKNGWSTETQLDFLRGPAAEFQIDQLIVSLVTNDPHIDGVSMPRKTFIWDKIARTLLPFHPDTVRFLVEPLNELLYRLPYFRGWGHQAWESALYEDDNLVAWEQRIAELEALERGRGVDTLFVSMPVPGRHEVREKYAKLFAILERQGISRFDLQEAVDARFGEFSPQQIRAKLWANPGNSHPGRPLTELYAAEIERHLESELGLGALIAHAQSAATGLADTGHGPDR